MPQWRADEEPGSQRPAKTCCFFAGNQVYKSETASAHRSQAHCEERATWLDIRECRGRLSLA